MRLTRFTRDLKALRGTYQSLADEAALADDEASYKLTLSARGFSRRTRRVVDDKLSFSATLMRAGEVRAASRLLDEVQDEVRTEEAALLEQVNEVKAAQAVRREKMTRLRLVRLVAVATLGSMLMGLSALGMTAASFFDARRADAARSAGGLLVAGSAAHERRARVLAHKLAMAGGSKRVAGLLMKLSPEDLAKLERLTYNGAGPGTLEHFLVATLPTPLAHKLATITGIASAASASAVSATKDTLADGVAVVAHVKKRAAKEEAAAKESAEEEKEESTEPADDSGTQKDGDDNEPADDGNDPPLPKQDPLSGGSDDSDGEAPDPGSLLDR